MEKLRAYWVSRAHQIKRLRSTLDGVLADNDTLRKEIDRLRAERDESRRMVCMLKFGRPTGDPVPQDIARKLGWDCFKEATDGTDPR